MAEAALRDEAFARVIDLEARLRSLVYNIDDDGEEETTVVKMPQDQIVEQRVREELAKKARLRVSPCLSSLWHFGGIACFVNVHATFDDLDCSNLAAFLFCLLPISDIPPAPGPQPGFGRA